MDAGISIWLIALVGALFVVPFLTNLVKLMLSSSKFAPVFALIIGVVYVICAGAMLGYVKDFSGVLNSILFGLGVGGGGVTIYDIYRSLIKKS